ncbi:hypothetical protein PHLCEN_2v2612 [Hermanssonia centrifuga]|uniref:Aminoglycoside phosphotransferase domain-containing protein n=1 Tax=Hermanssonia centrifuga TaxID=98765 RepID=A0A2R6RIN3_9APHY|nr:hypothetical protein PHLCEN_2v2612 [Hermanssonia centrifuga]
MLIGQYVALTFRQAPSKFDGLSDEAAISLLEAYDFAPGQNFMSISGMETPVWRLSPDTVFKCLYNFEGLSCEPYIMDLVYAQTTIPTPRIRKCVMWHDALYVFMEYIEGTDLAVAWPNLGWRKRLRIIWKLRTYVAQLRKVEVPDVPGRLDGTGRPLRCIGHFFTDDGAGPFASYAAMSAWFASKRRISIALEKWRATQRGKSYTSPDFRFDESMPLVLTHGDISLNNVRIGTDGTVWLLDWGRAGVYPRWFEYAAMMTYKDFLGQTPRSWLRLAPFVAGWYTLREVNPVIVSV